MNLKIMLKNLKWPALLKNHNFLIASLLILVLAESAFYFKSGPAQSRDLNKYADDIIALCAESQYHPACYDKAIPQLMDYISMEDAFKVTAIIQDKDRSYLYCHVLAHELSAREVQKNPSLWKDVVTRVPSGMCSNGGIHGGFQERFRGETFTDVELEAIKPEIIDLCEKRQSWSPTGLEQASCYHAFGHLNMYITSADIKKSLSLCNEFAVKSDGRDFRHICYDGVFMQMFQPLELEDFSLIKGKEVTKEKHEDFCNQFTGQAKGSCWSEGWPLYRKELEQPQGLTQFCSKASVEERDRCFIAIMYVLTAQFNLDSEKVVTYCSGLLKERRGECFASAAGRMIEIDYRNIDQAVALCTTAEKYDPKNLCFQELLKFSSYNYKVGSPEFYRVCNTLPGEWKGKCLEKV